MEDTSKMSKAGRFLITTASFVIVVAGMRAATSILVPFLLSVFIAVICAPALFWLLRKKIPNVLAVSIVLIGILVIGFFLAAFVGTSVNDFSNQLPLYQERLTQKTATITAWLNDHGMSLSGEGLRERFNPENIMKLVGSTLARLSGVLTNAFLILLTVVFILLEASGLPRKLRAATSHPEHSLAQFSQITESVNRYLAIKTWFSLATGIAIGVWLWVLGVNHPLLWGLLAFLLNYVPNIGSIIAAVPAVLLAFIQLGMGSAFLAALGYLVANTIFGNLLEPRFMGRGLGLSTLVVFISLVLWGWVLGPVGMILSVPLTMILKVALESNEDTRWIAIMLGPAPANAVPAKTEMEN